MKAYSKILFNRVLIIGVALLFQILFFVGLIWVFKEYSPAFYGFSVFISIVVVLWIVYDNSNPAYKIAWVIPICLMPIFGGIFYLVFGGNQLTKKEREKLQWVEDKTFELVGSREEVLTRMAKSSKMAANQAGYIQNFAYGPAYDDSETEYYPIGEDKFEAFKRELRKAKKFIFMEYFIIEEGQMWSEILEILKEKAAQGVDVRVIYDDMGCMLTLPFRYDQYLNTLGIKAVVFNPLIPIMSAKYNTRDHRKITVIDGHTAFTGGINLADEYINAIKKHGHWKDMGILVKGQAVWSFTVMFLTLWDYVNRTESDYQAYAYEPESGYSLKATGFVQPFADNPLDNEAVGENIYLNLINKAKDYVYITSPYLIIDSEMETALSIAAKSGVDVRIMTPHRADKWYVHEVTRSYYQELIRNGVRIFEYEPGFIHGKTFVVDDEYAVVGTINMDYRSLYLHFECGLWMYNTSSVIDVRNDHLDTLERCIEITNGEMEQQPFIRKLVQLVLRLFAPLM